MIVKVFGNRGGGSPKASLDYLQEKKEGEYRILQGDPDLSLDIANNLNYAQKYTVGCLSFEEEEIPEETKAELMERFENMVFAGLEPEQYNICWIEHTDKNRVELNFFIPNVELESGKRFQPYYDKNDRNLWDNFQKINNHEFNFSSPDDPQKKQTLITQQNLPKDKKQALESIDKGLTALAQQGKIKCRDDVIKALESNGFEIARITKKSISLKTEGQNLRLKGEFYNEDFRIGTDFSDEIRRRTEEYRSRSAERYKHAQEEFNSRVGKRREYNEKHYKRHRKEDQKTNLSNSINASIDHIHNNIIDNDRSVGLQFLRDEEEQQRDHKISDNIQGIYRQERPDNTEMWGRLLRSDRSEKTAIHENDQQEKTNISTNHNIKKSDAEKGKIDNEQSTSIRASIKRIVRKSQERFKKIFEFAESRTRDFALKVTRITSRKQTDQQAVQRDFKNFEHAKVNLINKVQSVNSLRDLHKQQKIKRAERSKSNSFCM